MLAMTQDRAGQNQRLSGIFESERRRLLAFIRSRIPDEYDAEDLAQDVFSELVEAYRLMKPIAHAGAWMMEVARNRITDLFRRGNREISEADADPDRRVLDEILPSPEAGPDTLYARSVLMAEIEAALEELPASQRDVFIAHEIEGRSFAQISAETGIRVNTLLSRKHYAVQRLRRRLQRVYEEAQNERKQL